MGICEGYQGWKNTKSLIRLITKPSLKGRHKGNDQISESFQEGHRNWKKSMVINAKFHLSENCWQISAVGINPKENYFHGGTETLANSVKSKEDSAFHQKIQY